MEDPCPVPAHRCHSWYPSTIELRLRVLKEDVGSSFKGSADELLLVRQLQIEPFQPHYLW